MRFNTPIIHNYLSTILFKMKLFLKVIYLNVIQSIYQDLNVLYIYMGGDPFTPGVNQKTYS